MQSQRPQLSFRNKLPRVYELKDLLPDPSNPDAYFHNFEQGLENSSQLAAFVKLEGWLAVLDDKAWDDLRERAAVHLVSKTRNTGRGWQALFDVLSEARAFGYLRSIDCTAVHFIKRATGKTPDLSAMLDGRQVLCEVKTINKSQEEAERSQRTHQGEFVARDGSPQVTEAFLGKLSATLEHAVEQLDGLDPERKVRRLVFVVVHFDDLVGLCQPEYFAQIDDHLLRSPVVGAELVFCPFTNLYRRTFTMRSATVLPE